MSVSTSYTKLLARRAKLMRAPAWVPLSPLIRTERHLLDGLNNKIAGAAFVKGLDIATSRPELHPDARSALAAGAARGGAFVVKPFTATLSRGVRMLTPQDGAWACAMQARRHATLDAVAAELPKGPYILESHVVDGQGHDVACDYKIYATKTACPFIQQRYAPTRLARAQYSYEFYDRAGHALGPIRRDSQSGVTRLQRPDNLEAAFAAAERIMAALDVSFIRIDGYLSTEGFVFGEFTPVPTGGSFGFTDAACDARLGQAWADSLAHLGMDYTLPQIMMGDHLLQRAHNLHNKLTRRLTRRKA